MDRSKSEYTLPEEFPLPAAEFTPPAPEFDASGYSVDPRKKRRRLRLLAAAAVVFLCLQSLPVSEPEAAVPPPKMMPQHGAAPMPEPTPQPTAAPASLPASAPAPGPASEPTPQPTAEPAPQSTSEPTPQPTPQPVPVCDITYVNFSADFHVSLRFTEPDRIISLDGEIWETNFDTLEYSFSVPSEKMETGVFGYEFNEGEVFQRHWDDYTAPDSTLYPELELRVTMVYEGEDGPVTVNYTEQARPQLGYSFRRFDPREEADDYTFPGCYVLQTYEANPAPTIVIDDTEAAKSGAISVSGEIDGRPIRMEDCELIVRPFALNDYLPPEEQLFVTLLVIPLPEHGSAIFTVYQILEGYGTPWITQYESTF